MALLGQGVGERPGEIEGIAPHVYVLLAGHLSSAGYGIFWRFLGSAISGSNFGARGGRYVALIFAL